MLSQLSEVVRLLQPQAMPSCWFPEGSCLLVLPTHVSSKRLETNTTWPTARCERASCKLRSYFQIQLPGTPHALINIFEPAPYGCKLEEGSVSCMCLCAARSGNVIQVIACCGRAVAYFWSALGDFCRSCRKSNRQRAHWHDYHEYLNISWSH